MYIYIYIQRAAKLRPRHRAKTKSSLAVLRRPLGRLAEAARFLVWSGRPLGGGLGVSWAFLRAKMAPSWAVLRLQVGSCGGRWAVLRRFLENIDFSFGLGGLLGEVWRVSG